MFINYVVTLVASLLLSFIFIHLLKTFSLRKGILISQGIPLVGGVAMALSFIIIIASSFNILINKIIPKEIIGILIASALMFIFELLDDRREMSVKAKFLVQLFACSILILFGIKTQIMHIGNQLNIIITFIWVIAITNAFNLLDILDGVAGVTSLVVSLALFTISFLKTDISTSLLLLALIGATLGFLIYNLPPAKVYMGNSGSHFLGFALASIALIVSYAPAERKIALIAPLLILGFPIFDTAFLILMRLLRKKLPFKKSNDHLVLRFLALGYSKKKALFVMFLWNVFFALCGTALVFVSKPAGIVLIAASFLATLVLTKKMSTVKIND